MKRKLLILSLLVILAALTAAGTLAYYTDSAGGQGADGGLRHHLRKGEYRPARMGGRGAHQAL